MTDFNIKKIIKYTEKQFDRAIKENKQNIPMYNFQINATLSLFDKNNDGKISKEEFNKISKEEFSIFNKEIKQYKTQNNQKPEKFYELYQTDEGEREYSYDELKSFLSDGYIDGSELNNPTKGFKLNSKQIFKEEKNLKSYNDMTQAELKQEKLKYNLPENKGVDFKAIRQEKNIIDENSDIVDFKIGTFNQGKSNLCTVDSSINQLSEEDLKKLYTQKKDKNGNIYFEINFPEDNGEKPIKVTLDEINNRHLSHKKEDIFGFSDGDADARLLEMAFVKRYGTDILKNGANPKLTLQRITGNSNIKTYDLITEDLLKENKKKLIGFESQKLTDFGIKNEIKLSNGEIVKIVDTEQIEESSMGSKNIILPNGDKIYSEHAFSVVGYDENSKEVIITDPRENSSNIRVPFELLSLFRLSQ